MATTLNVGDLAIIQYGSDTPDAVTFVILTDIDADTEIKFTDKGYDATLDAFGTNEGVLTWTPSVALLAGTVISISPSGGGIYTATNATTGTVLGTVTQSGSFNLAGAGDSIFAFQGDITGTSADAGLIYGVNFGDDDGGNPLDANGWNTLTLGGDTNETNLPDELNFALNGGINASYGNPTEIDNGYYDGITDGTPAEILAAIADPANWVTSDTLQGPQTYPAFGPNMAPLLADLETTTLSFDELEGEQNVTDNLTLTDSGDLTGATVTISAGFDMANDVLNFTDQNGITGVYDGMTGVLTLSGTATAADYQTALRSVTYNNAFTTESTATRTLSIEVTDGPNTTGPVVRDIDFVIDNTVSGTAGADILGSGFGTDVINGLGGDDRLFGQDGNDTLNGGDGNDRLEGGAGADVLNGGSGMDAVYYNHSDASIEFDLATGGTVGDAAGDTFISIERFYGSAFDDVMTGDASINVFYGLAGMDTLNGEAGNDLLYGQGGIDVLNGGDGTDRLFGGTDDDTLNGDAGDDFLYGQAGIDILNGGDGIDRLFGGTDDDTLNGDAGDDFLYGQTGNDILFGGLDNDIISGGTGNDDIDGGAGNDTALAGAGDDTVLGGAGDDIINGQSGINNLFGGDGNDTLISGTGDDVMDGGVGIDRALYSNSSAAVTVNLENDTGFGGNAEGDTFVSIENLVGSQFDDSLTGDALDNTISGLGGNDIIYGGAGNDRLVGAAGDDMLFGGDGDDILIAQEGVDTLDGGAGADHLIGGDDADIIIGGADDDFLLGQAGADTFVFGSAHGADRIVDFEQGVDIIAFDESSGVASLGDLTITQTGAHVLITSSAGTIAVNNTLVSDFDAADFDFGGLV